MKLTTSWQSVVSWQWAHSSGAKVTFYIDAKYTKQTIETNKTNLDVRLRSVLNAGSISGSGYDFSCSYCPTISGTGVWTFATETITSKSNQEIEHNADGTKKITLTATLKNTYQGLNKTISGEVEFPTIPRATTSPNLDGYIESDANITLNPAVATFKHRLYYSYNGKTGYYPSETGFFGATGSLPLDTSFYDYTPNSSGTGDLTLYTYDANGNLIGSKTSTITVRCDADKCRPTITATIIDSNSTTVALTGSNAKLVKGYSNAKITYTITARNGATISSKTINGSTLGTSPFTINKVTTGTFDIKAVDSRGFDTTLTKTNTMINYIPLKLNFNAFRTTPTGSEIKVNFTGDYFNDSFGSVENTLALSWKYRINGTSTWTTGGTLTKDTHYKISGNKFYSGTGSSASDIVLSSSLFNYKNAYEIGIFYQDKLINTSTAKVVPKGEPVLNWEDELVNVNGTLTIRGKDILEIIQEYINGS